MILQPGTKLGPYETLAPLGAGGMGEVWKARDTRLGRLVAIKTSHTRFSDRFEREARAIAALNHPHVCSLYDVGPDYLVMEYVEGQQLRGPVPLAKALALAEQILDALDAAHRRGIVHRDLKPENILLTQNGVKVLDFGIAKIERPTAAVGSEVVTEVASRTASGSIVGTLPYMSPEQVEGRDADARSDVFAFGVVLYELIAGRRPFAGETQTSLIASILKEEPPPLTDLQPALPPGVAAVVQTCLEKDPEKRWQSAREVKHALRWLAAARSVPAPARSVRAWQGLAAVMALIALGIGGWVFRPAAPRPVSRFEASVPDEVSGYDDVSLSPDGRKLVFTATGRDGLWIRDFDALEWRRLPGTEGGSTPFWSPDGRYLAFAVGREIRKVDTRGGPPETLSTLPNDQQGLGSWNRNGDILLGSNGVGSGGPLWKISQAGGAATAVTEVDVSGGERYHTWPTFLPDGSHFLYFRSGPPEVQGLYVGSLDAKPEEQSRQRILSSAAPAVYANGYVLFLRERTLMAQSFDARHLQLEGVPVPVAQDVEVAWFGTGVFSVSAGALAYRPASVPGTFQLTWMDRQGRALGMLGSPSTDSSVALSPDGKRAVVKDSGYHEPGDLWTLDVASGRRTRLTFQKDAYSLGVWSPDGAQIAYAGGHLGDTLYAKAASGLGDAQELLKEPGVGHYPTNWSSDGRFLLYTAEDDPKTGSDVWVLRLDGRKPYPLLRATYNEWAGAFSPDMRWFAYASLETGGGEIYVRPFRVSEPTGEPSVGDGKWQVSKNGANWPLWHDDNEIVFHDFSYSAQPTIFAVPVDTDAAAFESGVPQRLALPLGYAVGSADSTRDGQRFLVAIPHVQRTARASIRVVLEWPALLTK
jgi:predicted Ser/Thr protein kinase